MSSTVSISTDIGGTFTDVIVVDGDGAVLVAKSPTVPDDPILGVLNALDGAGISVSDANRFFHGTTIGINALLERKGATVGFVTTSGFRDLLEIGDGTWPPYRLTWRKPAALVAPRLIREVDERILSDGSVERPLDPAEVLAAVGELRDHGAEVIALCLYNAYVEPAHERRAGEAIAAAMPELPVVLSHELSRRYREAERATTTVAEAYLRPRMRRYFDDLAGGLQRAGFDGRLLITTSDGGVMGRELASRRALRTLVSGCAGGVSGAAVIGAENGWRNLLTIDVGGTSFDAAVIRDAQPALLQTAELAGLRFLVPMIDLATIGAGGGSIAGVDTAGGLSVGPRSAGAVPGPACYGRGGELPTFTDAALITGRLPSELLGGGMEIGAALAEAAIRREVAEPLRLSVGDAAAGVIAVIEARMAHTLEELTIGRGLDPRDFTMLAYGGGGPLVATGLAAELGISRIVVPCHPGAFSALGMQMLDIVHDFAQTRLHGLADVDDKEIVATFDGLCAEAAEVLGDEGVPDADVALLRSLEMRYDGQEHTLVVAVPSDLSRLAEVFGEQHQAAFGFTLDVDVEIVGYRVRAIGRLTPPVLRELEQGDTDPRAALVGHRTVLDRAIPQAGSWPIYDRMLLKAGDRIAGPAIVQEPTATTVVSHGFNVRVTSQGHLELTQEAPR
jgi:N-methylhydantoinase A